MSEKDDRSVVNVDTQKVREGNLLTDFVEKAISFGLANTDDYRSEVVLDDGTVGEGCGNTESEAVANAIEDARSK